MNLSKITIATLAAFTLVQAPAAVAANKKYLSEQSNNINKAQSSVVSPNDTNLAAKIGLESGNKLVVVKEIKSTLSVNFSIDISSKDIKKYLYILLKLGFVEESKIKKDDVKYYFSKLNYSLFKYSYHSRDTKLHRDEFVSQILLHYYKNDSRRQLAINNQGKDS